MVREQYPLTVSEAMTIHKAQGSTMETVTVQIGNAELERSLLYVACSRAKTINGLYLIGTFKAPKPPNQTHTPSREMTRLRESAQLIPKFQFLRMTPHNLIIQIASHNVQSLKAHFPIIANDFVFRNCNLLLFQETWAKQIDTFDLPNKEEIARSVIGSMAAGTGSIIFGDSNFDFTAGHQFQFHYQNIHVSCCKFQNLVIINVYRSPKAKLCDLKASLEHINRFYSDSNILICGDFNENIASNSSFVEYMKRTFNLNLLSPIQPTTNSGTTIDAVFGKLNDIAIEVFIYESFYSFHKPLVLRLFEKDH